MKYISTRGNFGKIDSVEAIRLGMVPNGGLFVPEEIPVFSGREIQEWKDLSYQEIAFRVLKRYLPDYREEVLIQDIQSAYNNNNFADAGIAPLKELTEQIYILELWHGPTAAFKDLALQLMPHLLTDAVSQSESDKEIVILVATSGDTGKAALEGFKDVEGVRIIVFYPEDGVSPIQQAQMTTTGGENTAVVAVAGNFDDCQNKVKELFADQAFNNQLSSRGFQLSSANSINWGRLVPQIVYYFYSYINLINRGKIRPGEEINITVPTGNFGNILAAYYAFRMGLPVHRFICASNDNNILTDFLQTGIYNIKREFQKTISPSMDILISSNLERFLFEVTGHDYEKIKKWYNKLAEESVFEVDGETLSLIREKFIGRYADEKETISMIKSVYDRYSYLLDPHTAVGFYAYQAYQQESGDKTATIIDSTANPYKFCRVVLQAINGPVEENDFKLLHQLKKQTGLDIHRGLKGLDEKQVRHRRRCPAAGIRDEIIDILSI